MCGCEIRKVSWVVPLGVLLWACCGLAASAVAQSSGPNAGLAVDALLPPTRASATFTYLKATGTGHIVGNILQAEGLQPGTTEFFEGDDQAVIDGKLAIPGTGSEDSFNGGWYDVPGRWDGRASFPLSGCLDYKKHLGRTGGYRLMISGAYSYRKSIDFTIEHGPEGNLIPTDYASTTFFYSQNPPAEDFKSSTGERHIADPEKIVFVPGWTLPIHSFSLENATVAKRTVTIAGKETRYLSFRATGEDTSLAVIISLSPVIFPPTGNTSWELRRLRALCKGWSRSIKTIFLRAVRLTFMRMPKRSALLSRWVAFS